MSDFQKPTSQTTGWQPAEMAPKDQHRPILTYSPTGGFWGGGAYTVTYWVDYAAGWFTWPAAEYEVDFTHWMHLPERPHYE